LQCAQYVAVCCSVLHYAILCCIMLQYAVVCCSALQCVAVCCTALQCIAVCCNVLQCVAVCCSVLQCVAVSVCYRARHVSTAVTAPWPSTPQQVLLAHHTAHIEYVYSCIYECITVRCSMLQCVEDIHVHIFI